MDTKKYTDALKSTVCACGEPKAGRQSFCKRCWRALPLSAQAALYDRLGLGYEASYDSAVGMLEGMGRIQPLLVNA